MAPGSDGCLRESSNGEEDEYLAAGPQRSLCQGPLSYNPTSFFRNLFNFQPAEIMQRKEYVMSTSHLTKTFALVLSLTVGIIGMTWAASDDTHPLPDILTDIERHIGELTINIEKISDRIEFLRKAPTSKDPLIEELRNLDIRGWETHQEQWKRQLEGLRFTEGLLRKVLDHPEEKSAAFTAWQNHIKEFKAAMHEFRQQRAGVEVLRIETATQLIEQYLR
jgi:hypothetical protein